jgi:hypothetical protein
MKGSFVTVRTVSLEWAVGATYHREERDGYKSRNRENNQQRHRATSTETGNGVGVAAVRANVTGIAVYKNCSSSQTLSS